MEKYVEVKRVRHGISYIPRSYVKDLADDANIISIVSDGDRRPNFKPGQRVLELTDMFMGLNGEDHQKALAFLDGLEGANCFVHCEMGQICSKNMARWLQHHRPHYRIACHSTDFVLAWYRA